MGNRPKFLKRPTGNLTGLSMMVGCYALSGKLGAGMRTVVVVALWCEQVADLPMRMVGENGRARWGILMRILRQHSNCCKTRLNARTAKQAYGGYRL